MDKIIAVSGLKKNFNGIQALAGVDFEVDRGELFGFLGPNGAGKTTTVNILTGLARPSSGTVSINGVDVTRRPKSIQHSIGVVPDESNLYPELSGYDNLCFCAALYGLDRPERGKRSRELLAEFGLTDAAGRKFGAYSKGMKRKLTIAAGIIHRPGILFLDEPTTGIDVASARHVRQLISDRHRSGITIFLTTHYIEEAERLCDRVAFLVAGRIVRTDTVERLIQPVQNERIIEITVAKASADIYGLLSRSFPGLKFTAAGPDRIRVETGPGARAGEIVRFLEERGIEVLEARMMKPTLEDIFVRITGIESTVLRKEKEKAGGSS